MLHGEKPQAHRIDMNTPSVARMYDWLLGGVENYAVDRAACRKLLKIAPSTQLLARSNRSFLQRVVRILVEEFKVRQFLDHGSGLPTEDNVHQIAQRIDPECKVAYVDNDPMVLAHARTILQENDETIVLGQDLRDTDEIRAATDSFFDWDQPIAALFVCVLHCLPDKPDHRSPEAVIRRITSQLAPGSFLVICQPVSDGALVRKEVTDLMSRSMPGSWGRVRQAHEVERYFDGMQVLAPGLVDIVDWRPDSPPPPRDLRPADWVEWGGVARL